MGKFDETVIGFKNRSTAFLKNLNPDFLSDGEWDERKVSIKELSSVKTVNDVMKYLGVKRSDVFARALQSGLRQFGLASRVVVNDEFFDVLISAERPVEYASLRLRFGDEE